VLLFFTIDNVDEALLSSSESESLSLVSLLPPGFGLLLPPFLLFRPPNELPDILGMWPTVDLRAEEPNGF